MTATGGTTPKPTLAERPSAEEQRSWTEIRSPGRCWPASCWASARECRCLSWFRWCRPGCCDNGVDLATIGLFALVGLPYTWKFSGLLPDGPVQAADPRSTARWPPGGRLLTELLLLLSISLCSATSIHQPRSKRSCAIVFAVALYSAPAKTLSSTPTGASYWPTTSPGTGTSFWITPTVCRDWCRALWLLILADHVPWSVAFWIDRRPSCWSAS